MTAYGARRTVLPPLQAAGDRVRRVIARLFPVRPERRPGALPALPLARKEVIKGDPSRYGFVRRKKLPASDGRPPWGDTATFPAITDELMRAIESGTYSTGQCGGMPC